jgi:hypothetical protein
MVQYFLYKSRNTTSPFVVVNPDTIDDSSTSVFLIGQGKESYGQPEQQSKLWTLENFANTSKPAPAILGQEWFNTSDNQMYHCVNESQQTFQKISKPIVSAAAPTSGILTTGDLWYNTTDGRIYVLSQDGVTWTAVGPITSIPLPIQQEYYFNIITSNATQTEMGIDGVPSNRLVIPPNQSWLYEINLIARAEETVSEVVGMKFKGIIDRPATGATNIVGGGSKEILGVSTSLQTPTLADASVSANTSANSLSIYVTGQAGKTIQWNATVEITIVSQ